MDQQSGEREQVVSLFELGGNHLRFGVPVWTVCVGPRFWQIWRRGLGGEGFEFGNSRFCSSERFILGLQGVH